MTINGGGAYEMISRTSGPCIKSTQKPDTNGERSGPPNKLLTHPPTWHYHTPSMKGIAGPTLASLTSEAMDRKVIGRQESSDWQKSRD